MWITLVPSEIQPASVHEKGNLSLFFEINLTSQNSSPFDLFAFCTRIMYFYSQTNIDCRKFTYRGFELAKQFSPSQFFRKVPNTLLARFFQARHGVLLDVPIETLEEAQIKPIFAAFTQITSDLRRKIDSECQSVEIMACQGGITALTDEALSHGDVDFPRKVSELGGAHEIAMWAFLNYLNYWEGATLFFHADNIAESFWKKRNDLPSLIAQTDQGALERLAKSISHFFNQKEGRGRNCEVDYLQRNHKQYFFAYPEDYAQLGVEWVSNALAAHSRNPAFEIIFVYCQQEGSLDIYAKRNTKYIHQLQQFFAKDILELDHLEPFNRNKLIYDLDPLALRGFQFQFDQGSGIESVSINRLRLTLKGGSNDKVTLDAKNKFNPKAIYDLLANLDLPPYYVNQAEIKVQFSPSPHTRSRIRRFCITYPDKCALGHDGRDGIIRQMLINSGIEPQQPNPLLDEMAS